MKKVVTLFLCIALVACSNFKQGSTEKATKKTPITKRDGDSLVGHYVMNLGDMTLSGQPGEKSTRSFYPPGNFAAYVKERKGDWVFVLDLWLIDRGSIDGYGWTKWRDGDKMLLEVMKVPPVIEGDEDSPLYYLK